MNGESSRRTAPERRDTRLRFEQWARNPTCEANTVSAVHGIRMADVAKSEGIKPTMGQSPFALARGQNFERGLFRDRGKRLVAELTRMGVLDAGGSDFVDFRLRPNGGPYANLDEARQATSALLREVADSSSGARQMLAAGATVSVPGGVMLPEALLVIDALVIRRDLEPPRLVVGEIKTYPDRGGYTDTAELAQARAQAGVYVHGLELVSRDLGIAGKVEVARNGFLVLSRPGSNFPSIRAGEELEYQAKRAERGFERLRAAAALVIPLAEPGRFEAVRNAATTYGEACLSFCDRAAGCYEKALSSGAPGVLGDEMRRFLGAVDLFRAVALLGGEKPQTEAERDLKRRFDEAEGLGAP